MMFNQLLEKQKLMTKKKSVLHVIPTKNKIDRHKAEQERAALKKQMDDLQKLVEARFAQLGLPAPKPFSATSNIDDNLVEQTIANQAQPNSFAVFKQNDFKAKHLNDQKTHPSLFQPKPGSPLNAGLCGGLLFTWYEQLCKGKNLLDLLADNNPPKDLIQLIISRQHELGAGATLKQPSDSKANPANKIYLQGIKHPAQEHFNFAQMDTILIPSDYHDTIIRHVESLEESNLNKVGLHTIAAFPKDDYGHICGWTACEGGFLLFDPDQGEFFFDNFSTFKNYLNHHLLNMFSGDTDLSLTLFDCYHAEDLVPVQQSTVSKPSSSST